jgi:hypothetical protein
MPVMLDYCNACRGSESGPGGTVQARVRETEASRSTMRSQRHRSTGRDHLTTRFLLLRLDTSLFLETLHSTAALLRLATTRRLSDSYSG